MREYISREAAINKLLQCADGYDPDYSDITVAHAMSKIKEIPEADVVEVVRCKDCNRNRGVTTDMWGNPAVQCDYEIDYKPLDWYCAAGEKE